MHDGKDYYLAILFAMGFVFIQHKDKPLLMRSGIAGVSGGLGYVLSPEVADMLGIGQTVTVVLLTIFAYIVFDTLGALFADRESIKEIVKQRLGGRK